MYIVFVDVAATVQICTGDQFSRAKNLRKRRTKFARKNAKQTACSVPAMRGVFLCRQKRQDTCVQESSVSCWQS